MGKIRVLPPELVNQIAAGEVIERPASIVKELVENALDAGARRIEVALEEGGRRLVRVADDGEGIEPEDLPLAHASHATSKLGADPDGAEGRGVEALFGVRTLGFRGEALASLAAVAEVRIVSRARSAGPGAEGAEIEAAGGAVLRPRPCAAAFGTTVEVRNLFGNVPARRKFLREAGTELRACIEAVTRLAVFAPAVDFVVSHEGRRAVEAVADALTPTPSRGE